MKKGFTLIELLAVIVIIGILSLISVNIVTNIIQKAKLESFNSEAKNIERTAEMYAINNYILTSIESGEEYILNIEDMEDYLDGVTTNVENQKVIIRNINGYFYYYYTGRDNNPYTSMGTLKGVIEENIGESHLTNMIVNGSSVTKVIGTKGEKTNIKNWVWFSGQLWQVIETTDDYVKLVTANSVTSISYGSNNTWSTSWVRKWLNEIDGSSNQDGIYYHNLSRTDLLKSGNFCLDEPIGVVITSDKVTNFTPISTCSSISTDKIGLLTFEDYLYAEDGTIAGADGGSFLDEDERSWTMTKRSTSNIMWATTSNDPSNLSYNTSYIGATNSYGMGVRPVIYLSYDLLIKSNDDSDYGTATNPYILIAKEDKTSGDKLNSATIGSFIYIEEEQEASNNTIEVVTSRISYTYDNSKVRYRIIGINNDGTIRVQRADILKKISSSYTTINDGTYMAYYFKNNGDSETNCVYLDTWYYTGCADHNYFQPLQGEGLYKILESENIGYFLNTASNGFYESWLPLNIKNKIVETEYNLTVNSYGYDYIRTMFNNDLSTDYPNRTSDGVINSKVFLPSWGDMFSGNDLNTSYWLINRHNASTSRASIISSSGYAYSVYPASAWTGARPVFNLDSNMTINSGSGTMKDPYTLNWN